jgi:tryptophanase
VRGRVCPGEPGDAASLAPPAGQTALDLSAQAGAAANPGQALACALYLEAGVRAAEMGSFGFARTNPDGSPAPAAHELLRLALPRRVYTRNHLEYVAETLTRIAASPETLNGYRIVNQPATLRHFTAALEPVDAGGRPVDVETAGRRHA